ncbi:MAG TPA: hypothetical protein VMZ03_07325 [Chitinophagaceae bacterium]|nr:hypothetical protein [Chitinophagaceae bacterium]
MKKIIAAALVLSVSFAVNAQDIPERKADKPGMYERHRKGHHGMDMKQLNLTDAQKEQFKKEKESFKQQMVELKKNDNITVKEWKSRRESIQKAHKTKIEGILTTDQKAQLEKNKREGQARRDGMMKDREGMMKNRGEEMKTRLGLTDEQSAKLQQNRKEVGEKMRAIRENKSLSEEKKREEIKEIMKGQKESLKSILTEEQMQKMKEERKQNPHRDADKKDMKKTI